MKKITSIIVISVLLATLLALGTYAASYTASGKGDDFSWRINDDGELYIWGDYIKSFGTNSNNRAPWYEYKSEITSIRIDDDLYDIGRYAFYGLSKVKTVDLPEDLNKIGAYAFSDCTSLKTIDIPNYVGTIGSGAFYNCTSLKSVSLPLNLKTIEASAFYNCKSLTEVMIYDAVKTIGDNAFANCSKLTEVFFVGNRPTSVSDSAFEDLDDNDDLVIYYTKGSSGFTKSYWPNYELETFTYNGKTSSSDDDDDGWLDDDDDDDDIYCGDLNDDGKVNTTDLRLMRYTLAYYKTYTYKKYEDRADVDEDGELTPMDEMYLARHLDGWKGYKLP